MTDSSRYTYGPSAGVVSVHAARSATREAAFFLPHVALLSAAGFAGVKTSTSFRWDGSQDDGVHGSRAFGQLLAQRLSMPNFAGPIVANGWDDQPTLERVSAACARWSEHPDAYAAMIMVEAVGWKEGVSQ